MLEYTNVGEWTLLGSNVLVAVAQSPDKSDGGILIPDIAQHALCEGIVAKVGAGKLIKGGVGGQFMRHPVDVNIGDRVFFSENVGIKVKLDGKDYVLLDESGLICTMDGKQTLLEQETDCG